MSDLFADKAATYFIPLGGSGEIGSNLNLYHHAGKWLMLDCGVSFGDGVPGIDTTMPDPEFIAERREDLVGLVVTHGHEDHLGAVEYLWSQLQCPVFTTPFTAALLRHKLGDTHSKIRIIEMRPGDKRTLGPFTFEFIAVTHSIPDAVMVVVTTPTGKILHTGDWKFDPEPLISHLTDFKRLEALGNEGVLAAIGDSTNAMLPGISGSEASTRTALIELVKRQPQRVFITCFASNVARLRIAAEAAQASDRTLAFVGRSLWRMLDVADECHYWDYPEPADEEEAGFLPPERALIVCTGCQGETRAAMARIANDAHPDVRIDAGDTVIFSSRDIPGNEDEIQAVQDQLRALGAHVITIDDVQDEGVVHVSGHPAQQELTRLYTLTKPQIIIPVHGEPPHQKAHAKLAHDLGVTKTFIPANGDVLKFTADAVAHIGRVRVGKLGVVGKKKLVPVTVNPNIHHGGS